MLAVFEGAEDGNIQHEARTSRMGAGKVRAVLTACSPIITFPICTLLCTLPFILWCTVGLHFHGVAEFDFSFFFRPQNYFGIPQDTIKKVS